MHYHNNAKTNIKQREYVKNSLKSNRELKAELLVSHVTIGKWKKANNVADKSSRPHCIHYTLNKADERIIVAIRDKLLMSVDDLLNQLEPYINKINRINIYRTLVRYRRNCLTVEQKQRAKQFADCLPGFLHVDILKLPKIDGQKYYCFLAIERKTRLIYLQVYKRQSAKEAGDFVVRCLDFFPMIIHTVLTDNGRQFTMKNQTSFGQKCAGQTLFETICEIFEIKYRKTKVYHPWTNGMAERAVRTVKEHTIRIQQYRGSEEMINHIYQFQNHHNLYRRLKVLGFKTPLQISIEWYVKCPELFLFNPTQLETTL